jgi:hypothetical protein
MCLWFYGILLYKTILAGREGREGEGARGEVKSEEEFKRIKGFEKQYLISNHGRVVRLFKNGKKFKEKKQTENHNGYSRVYLWKGNKRFTLRVHRLVAEHFLINDDPEIKLEVHHKDRNKKNNYFENLVWCTFHENMEWYHH